MKQETNVIIKTFAMATFVYSRTNVGELNL